jgi:hypothetical protein
MISVNKINDIKKIINKYEKITYRIINNTLSKNLILLSGKSNNLKSLLDELNNDNLKKYIQEIIIENDEIDVDFIENIKDICDENSVIHRNISYINWSDRSEEKYDLSDKKFYNIISGYSFKGGMGRSKTLAYLAYFYALSGKKIVALDCDFEAPGLANTFFEKQEREQKSGILDYFVDLNIDSELSLDNYYLKEDNLYIFPSGIDYDIENYINKISKIDFNSTSYFNKIIKLLDNINQQIKPDLIFIDLRAGINESNGIILKKLSNMNLMFFNGEEQNKSGLQVVLSAFKNPENKPIIMNSTIRYQFPEERENREKILIKYLLKENMSEIKNITPVKYKSEMLESSIENFKKFVIKEKNSVRIEKDNKPYSGQFSMDDDIQIESYISGVITKIDDKFLDKKYILSKLETHFSGNLNLPNTLDYKEFIMNEVKECLSEEELFKVHLLGIENKNDFYEIMLGRKNKDKPLKLKREYIKNNNVIEFMKSVIKIEIGLAVVLNDYGTVMENKHLFILTSNGNKYKRYWNDISLSI